MSARIAIAKEAEISTCAASAAQDIRKAPPTIPSPKIIADNIGSKWTSPITMAKEGNPRAAKANIKSQQDVYWLIFIILESYVMRISSCRV